MKVPWLPPQHQAPLSLEEPGSFTLRPLKLRDMVLDYDAVMSSRAEIFECFGPGTDWPNASLTVEQDCVDLGWYCPKCIAREIGK